MERGQNDQLGMTTDAVLFIAPTPHHHKATMRGRRLLAGGPVGRSSHGPHDKVPTIEASAGDDGDSK